MANTHTMTSVALPKDAFNKPPMVSLVCKANCSVTSPNAAANGMMPNMHVAKMAPGT